MTSTMTPASKTSDGGELLPDGVRRDVVGAQLGDVPARRDARLGEVPGDRLGHLARVDGAERKLHGGVAVGFRSADSGDDDRPGRDDRHRDDPVRFVEDLGHPELVAQDSLDRVCHVGSTHLLCRRVQLVALTGRRT